MFGDGVDAKKVMEIDASFPKIAETVRRLEKAHEEYMEKLKSEAMGKLKELGNSILGNFGLSLDNFKMQQDPSTGSWNIRWAMMMTMMVISGGG